LREDRGSLLRRIGRDRGVGSRNLLERIPVLEIPLAEHVLTGLNDQRNSVWVLVYPPLQCFGIGLQLPPALLGLLRQLGMPDGCAQCHGSLSADATSRRVDMSRLRSVEPFGFPLAVDQRHQRERPA
jgi:hypothetical protein